MAAPAVDRAAWASPWRQRSVADKTFLSLGLVIAAIAAPHVAGAVAVLVVAVACALAWARVPPGLYVRALAAPAAFIAVGAASIAVSVGPPAADSLWSWGLLSSTPATLWLAATVAARGLAGTAAVLLLACTTPMTDLLEGLRRARTPDALIEVASLTYRLLFLLVEVSDVVRSSQSARLGHDGFARSWRSTGLLASAVLVRAWDRARRLDDGLTGRGFEGSLRTLAPVHPRSVAFEVCSAGLLAILVVIQVAGPVIG
ncbi:cobalt ECF transporter T component CbiQ [Mariniluteicoccus flavus]